MERRSDSLGLIAMFVTTLTSKRTGWLINLAVDFIFNFVRQRHSFVHAPPDLVDGANREK